jgi:hypothetical protein
MKETRDGSWQKWINSRERKQITGIRKEGVYSHCTFQYQKDNQGKMKNNIHMNWTT